MLKYLIISPTDIDPAGEDPAGEDPAGEDPAVEEFQSNFGARIRYYPEFVWVVVPVITLFCDSHVIVTCRIQTLCD